MPPHNPAGAAGDAASDHDHPQATATTTSSSSSASPADASDPTATPPGGMPGSADPSGAPHPPSGEDARTHHPAAAAFASAAPAAGGHAAAPVPLRHRLLAAARRARGMGDGRRCASATLAGAAEALLAGIRDAKLRKRLNHLQATRGALQEQIGGEGTAATAAATDHLQEQLDSTSQEISCVSRHLKDCGKHLVGAAKDMWNHSKAKQGHHPHPGVAGADHAGGTDSEKRKLLLVETRAKEGVKFSVRQVAARGAEKTLKQKIRTIEAVSSAKEAERGELRQRLADLKHTRRFLEKDLSRLQQAQEEGGPATAGSPGRQYDLTLQEGRANLFVVEEKLRNLKAELRQIDAKWQAEMPTLTADEERIYRGMTAVKQDRGTRQMEEEFKANRARQRQKLREQLLHRGKGDHPAHHGQEAEGAGEGETAAAGAEGEAPAPPLRAGELAELRRAFYTQASLHYAAAAATLSDRIAELRRAFEVLEAADRLVDWVPVGAVGSGVEEEEEVVLLEVDPRGILEQSLAVWGLAQGLEAARERVAVEHAADLALAQLLPAERAEQRRACVQQACPAPGFKHSGFLEALRIRVATNRADMPGAGGQGTTPTGGSTENAQPSSSSSSDTPAVRPHRLSHCTAAGMLPAAEVCSLREALLANTRRGHHGHRSHPRDTSGDADGDPVSCYSVRPYSRLQVERVLFDTCRFEDLLGCAVSGVASVALCAAALLSSDSFSAVLVGRLRLAKAQTASIVLAACVWHATGAAHAQLRAATSLLTGAFASRGPQQARSRRSSFAPSRWSALRGGIPAAMQQRRGAVRSGTSITATPTAGGRSPQADTGAPHSGARAMVWLSSDTQGQQQADQPQGGRCAPFWERVYTAPCRMHVRREGHAAESHLIGALSHALQAEEARRRRGVVAGRRLRCAGSAPPTPKGHGLLGAAGLGVAAPVPHAVVLSEPFSTVVVQLELRVVRAAVHRLVSPAEGIALAWVANGCDVVPALRSLRLGESGLLTPHPQPKGKGKQGRHGTTPARAFVPPGCAALKQAWRMAELAGVECLGAWRRPSPQGLPC